MSKVKISLLCAGIGLSLFALSGCGQKDPVEAVRQRAIERWDLLGGGHAVKAYDYLSPGYRSTHTLEQYVAFVATSRIKWNSAKVDSVQCDEDLCTAKLNVASTIPGALLHRPTDLELTSPVAEKWVRSDGQWFFLPDAKISPEGIAKEAVEAKSEEAKAPVDTGAPPGPASPSAEEGHKEGQKQP